MLPSKSYDLAYLLSRANLPSLPEAVIKLNQAINDDATLEEIEAIIAVEPALSARIMHLANTAWYHMEQPVTTIRDAVSNIGFHTLHRLIIITSVIEIFQGVDSTLLNMKTYWKQSVRMGCAARVLAEQSGNNEHQLFTSGVLAYIGKLVLSIGIPSVEQKALLISKDDAIPLYRAEVQMIGHHHAEVGSELLRKWYIPDALACPIHYFYEPERAPAEFALDAAILNIAHHMQYTFWHDIALTDPPAKPSELALQTLGLREDMLPGLSRRVDEEYREVRGLLEV